MVDDILFQVQRGDKTITGRADGSFSLSVHNSTADESLSVRIAMNAGDGEWVRSTLAKLQRMTCKADPYKSTADELDAAIELSGVTC